MLVVKENVSQVSSALRTTSKHTSKTYHTQNFLAGQQKCFCSSATRDGRRWPPRRTAALSPPTTGAAISAGSHRGSCRCWCGCRETNPTQLAVSSARREGCKAHGPFMLVTFLPSLQQEWKEEKACRLSSKHWWSCLCHTFKWHFISTQNNASLYSRGTPWCLIIQFSEWSPAAFISILTVTQHLLLRKELWVQMKVETQDYFFF